MIFLYSRKKTKTGFTLVEVTIYVALFAVISIFLLQGLILLGTAYRRLQAERDVVASMRSAVETLGREVKSARGIYTATSIFGSATSSQLSLEVPTAALTNETTYFVDFYVDNGRLYIKREGETAFAITSESVVVSEFNVNRVLSGSREAAQITMRISSRSLGVLQTTSFVTASFSPRDIY
jgi:type II secretory pathway component PulJ